MSIKKKYPFWFVYLIFWKRIPVEYRNWFRKMKCNSLSFKRHCTQMTMRNYTNFTSGTGDFVKRCLLHLCFSCGSWESSSWHKSCRFDCTVPVAGHLNMDLGLLETICHWRSLSSLRINQDTRSDVYTSIIRS